MNNCGRDSQINNLAQRFNQINNKNYDDYDEKYRKIKFNFDDALQQQFLQ